MILLKLISWPYFRRHVLRVLLTTAGIVLGVSVFVGMHVANQSVLLGFSETVDRIAGKTQLQVTAGESGFDEEILERVQSAPSVRVAVPVIEAVVSLKDKEQGSLLVLGVDMTGDRSLRDYDLESGEDAIVEDPLVFLAQPDSLIVTQPFADRNGLDVGSELVLETAVGERAFVIRGIMKPSGLASAFGGNLAVMDIYAAQKMFGRGRKFDRIDLAVKPDRTISESQAEVQPLLGPGFQVAPPSARGQQFETLLSSYSLMMTISSLLALFIGMFIIYNSFSIAVTERRSEIGILRALGATRRQIRYLFLGESAVTGLIGSVAGIALGILIASAIAASVGTLIADVYGVAQHVGELATSGPLLAGALGIGVTTSMVAALLPAWNAARVNPVQALQKGKYQVLSAGENRWRAVLAVAAAVVSAVCLTNTGSRTVFYLGYVLAILVALLLTPFLSLVLAKALRPILRLVRPVEGALAADSLIQAPRRTSASVAALMLSLAAVVGFAGIARASYDSILAWMNTTLNPDLIVLPSESVIDRTMRLPATIAPEMTAIAGVARVQMVREARIVFRDTPVMIVAIDVASVAQTARRRAVAGDPAEMHQLTAAGQGVMVSENLAQLQRLDLGEQIEIAAPFGVIRLPIVGIVVDYSDQQGSIIMDRALFARYWHDDSVNAFRVYVEAGINPLNVKDRILSRFAGEQQVFVLTNRELKDYILRLTSQWLSLSSVQIAVAVLVAILGIVNTLTVSITDRRRELGVLRAVGGRHWQIRRTIWMEALAIATIGLVLGFGLGAMNLYYTLEIVRLDLAGMRLAYKLPVDVVGMLVPAMLAAAAVAAVWPAESAVRGSLIEALEYE
jgi:putative ABC transport system permease protein